MIGASLFIKDAHSQKKKKKMNTPPKQSESRSRSSPPMVTTQNCKSFSKNDAS
jgi:hypothetical protein